MIGFIQKYKNKKLDDIIIGKRKTNKVKTTYDINSIDDLGFHDVFDMTVEADEHTYWTGGLLVSNCQEYWSIPYSSCNLGSINLSNLVNNQQFDWEKFDTIIRLSTRFLNNVIDVNVFPIQKIHDITHKVRSVGLGYMGLAHTLYQLKIPFNSEEGYKFKTKITERLTKVSMLESIEIAKQDKAYEAFDYDLYVKANERFFNNEYFLDQIKTVDVLTDLRQYGTANSCNSSLAPTGTISYLANTTGGVEPVFALTYARKIEKTNREYEVVYISDKIFDEYLTDNFDSKTKEKILKQVADNRGSCQKVKEIPEEDRKVFVVASDLSPMEHLQSLESIASMVSTSCSKTINMPAEATKEEISEVYLKAHKMGIIGVSVYRDGCRDGILVHKVDEQNKDVIVRNNAPKRPKSLPAHVYRVNILNKITDQPEKWIIFVGLLNDEPYEIIAGKINGHDFDSSVTEGEIVKTKLNGKKVYQFVKDGEVLCENICSQYLNDIREYSTRLMSLALRHGAGIEHLQTVLKKSGTIVDFNQAIVRAITRYCKEMKSKEKCPTCNEELIYVEGCVKCSNPTCSYSKCS
jgi:ribonucleoside-diphosphate reductase alpha chain